MKLKLILGLGLLLGVFLPAMGDGGASRYTGRVVDEQGHPVAGATVECYRYPDDITGFSYDNREPEEDQSIQTDIRGEFSVAASRGTTQVVVKKAGLATAWKTWSNGPEDTSDPVVLSPPSFLAGMVVDDSGRPVAGAEVWVAGANGLSGQPARQCFSARTGPDGRFRIENFPAHGRAVLAVAKAGLAQHPINDDIPDALAGDENIQLVLGPAGAVAGKVLEAATGRPLAGVTIKLDGRDGHIYGAFYHAPVVSGANGDFLAPDLPPGKYYVNAFIPRPLQSDWVVLPENGELEVVAGTTTSNLLIHVTHGAVMDVFVVVTNSMKPLAGVIVTSGQNTGITDSKGLARIRVQPGKAWARAVKPGWISSQIMSPTELTAGVTNQLRIELTPPRRIAGTVRDQAGAPVAGALVSFHPGHNPEAPKYVETTTDAAGHYEMVMNEVEVFEGWFGSIDQTNYILARCLERNLAMLQEFTELPAQLDLALQPGLTLSGSVVDPAGAPVTNATVDPSMEVGQATQHLWPHPVPVDARGSFLFPGLPQGREYFSDLTAPDYGTVYSPLEAKYTRTNHYEFPALVLRRADLRLAGQVLGQDGQPLPGVRVNFYGRGQLERNETFSGVNGRFQFENVCAGEVKVSVSSGDGLVSARGGDLNVVLRTRH